MLNNENKSQNIEHSEYLDNLKSELKEFHPIVEDMSNEEFNDWLSDRHVQYKSETPEEHEEHDR